MAKGIRGMIKKLSSASAYLVASGPVTIPAFLAVNHQINSPGATMYGSAQTFVYEMTGYDIAQNKIVNTKLAEVLVRDATLIGIGYALKWWARKQ